jgi:hypothetical protein
MFHFGNCKLMVKLDIHILTIVKGYIFIQVLSVKLSRTQANKLPHIFVFSTSMSRENLSLH